MEAKRQKTIDGLKEVLIYLAICCYSPETEYHTLADAKKAAEKGE